jgi:hypothetical protein
MWLRSRQRSIVGTPCVLLLAVSVLLFATYLKVVSVHDASGSGSPSQIKFRLNPAAGWDAKIKLPPTGTRFNTKVSNVYDKPIAARRDDGRAIGAAL